MASEVHTSKCWNTVSPVKMWVWVTDRLLVCLQVVLQLILDHRGLIWERHLNRLSFYFFPQWVYFCLDCAPVDANKMNWEITICQRLLKLKGLSESWKNAQILVLCSQYQNLNFMVTWKKKPSSKKNLPFNLSLPLRQSKPFPLSEPNFLEKKQQKWK